MSWEIKKNHGISKKPAGDPVRAKKGIYAKAVATGLVFALMLNLTGCAGKSGETADNGKVNEMTNDNTNGLTSDSEVASTPAATAVPEPEATATPVPEVAEPTAAPTGTGQGDAASNEVTASPQEIYAEAVEKSLVFTGNNYRLKKVIEKLRAGQDVFVAALGGSVTEGAGASVNDKGYAYLFAEDLKKTYAPEGSDTVHFVDAGLSGTPSSLGIMRYKQDVLDLLGAVPDLLIIEFAVNDWNEVTSGRAYESLICEALTANEECAVISLCSVSKGNWNTQDVYLPIAKNYLVPLVSVRNAVFKSLNSKTARIDESMYFYDEYHPASYGHTLMKNCLMNLLKTVDEAEPNVPKEIPEEAVKGRDFMNLVTVDALNTVEGLDPGSFGSTDDKVVTMYFTKAVSFPNNFCHKAGDENIPLKLKVKCKNILINFKTSTDAGFGSIAVYIDGEPVKIKYDGKLVDTIDGRKDGSWNNCNVALVLDEQEAAEHTMEIKMAEGSEDKSFTILSIGYTE
ncbi:MAG: SGNH/GDSL hydrolase family protein [Lachnospiraceae bacterium]|nr:SGNH/GDSL hydrolase family protein [Lachnospiraceae bacterium]